jgi:hypothetical protein
MMVVSLDRLIEQVEARKLATGLLDTPEATEAMRNKGGQRTPAKRELLRRTEERARARGLAPVAAYY